MQTLTPDTGAGAQADGAPAVDAAVARKLAAYEKTIQALMRRVEERQADHATGFALLEQNVSLGRIISRKTSEMERERRELHAALDELRKTQARLLQAQKMESIGQLAAGVAHEINTPTQYVSDNITFLAGCFRSLLAALDVSVAVVAAARGGAPAPDMLDGADAAIRRAKLGFLREQIPAALEQSQEGLSRIATIVSAMKEFSHPSAGEKEPIDIADIVRTSVTVARNEWKYVADLETDFAACLPPVPCLRDEIGQAVLNLVVNAAHAIAAKMAGERREKGVIRIHTACVDEFAELRVSDTGTGIPARIRDRIFDPFFTTKPVGQGTGQGLAIVYSTVVEKHAGQVFFETEEGRGTTFVVRLPLQPKPTSTAAGTQP